MVKHSGLFAVDNLALIVEIGNGWDGLKYGPGSTSVMTQFIAKSFVKVYRMHCYVCMWKMLAPFHFVSHTLYQVHVCGCICH